MLKDHQHAFSTLKVTASDTLDISRDLESSSNKSISELLDEEKKEDNKENQTEKD
jgi:hypothetical protein